MEITGLSNGSVLQVNTVPKSILFWTNYYFFKQRFVLRNLKEFGFGKQSMENVIMIEAEELVFHLKKQSGTPISTRTLFNMVNNHLSVIRTFHILFPSEIIILANLTN